MPVDISLHWSAPVPDQAVRVVWFGVLLVHGLGHFGAMCVGVIAAAVLLITYYIQVTVMQPNIEKGQLDGWAMLTMYNPNGVFLALEELGYLLMSVAFLCVAPVFMQATRLERSLRWLLVASFVLSLGSLVAVFVVQGIDRGATFEIIVISIVWLTLILGAILTALVFRRALHADTGVSRASGIVDMAQTAN